MKPITEFLSRILKGTKNSTQEESTGIVSETMTTAQSSQKQDGLTQSDKTLTNNTKQMKNTDLSLEFFKPVVVDSNIRQARIQENIAKLRVKSNVLAFSSEFGRTLKDFGYCMFMENSLTGDYALVFLKNGNTNCFPIHFKSGECSYVTVASKALVKTIAKKLGVEKDYAELLLGKNVSRNTDAVFRMIESVSE